MIRRLKNRLAKEQRRLRFAASLRHLHGPRQPDIAPNEVLVIALVRDGSYYLDAFFDHYRAMGARHFAFIDNGSTDDTIDRIKAEPGTIIDQSSLPLATYEDLLRQFPARRYGQNRWCLYVDMDEMFDFEGRADVGLAGLRRYLETQGFTAFVAQMLEMFPEEPLSDVSDLSFDAVLRRFEHYDLSDIRRRPYHAEEIPFSALPQANSLSNEDTPFLFGGIRHKVFGEDCCLTKHPLIFNGPGVVPAPHPHVSTGVRCADFTGVIKHYKFANDPLARDAASVASGRLDHGEDAKRAEVFARQPDLTLHSPEALRWGGIEPLYRAGFLQSSDAYRDFLAEGAV